MTRYNKRFADANYIKTRVLIVINRWMNPRISVDLIIS